MNAMKTVIIGLAVVLAAIIGYTVYLHQGPIKNITNENQNLLAEIDQLETFSTDMNSAHKAELDNRTRREKELETKNMVLEEAVARVTKEKEMVEIELEKLVSQISKERADLTQSKIDLENQLAALQIRFQAISDDTAAKDQKVAEMEKNRESLLIQIESQKKEKEELERLKNALKNQLGMTQSQIEGLSIDAATIEKQLKSKEQQLKSMKLAYEELSKQFEQQIREKEIQINNLEDKLSIRLLDKILFGSGSADITSVGYRVLESLATELKKMDGFEIAVGGHTDNKPLGPKIRKVYCDNLGLSVARAAAVSRALREMGVSPDNLSAVGYSEYRPVAENDTWEGRQQNRRVEIMLEPLR